MIIKNNEQKKLKSPDICLVYISINEMPIICTTKLISIIKVINNMK
ncbi:hypothetical protein FACS1894153_3830 [Bacteroidia bacterium]|nr:hypothetical protein FACS1894153_3830 [Bacteroidia bacterium]